MTWWRRVFRRWALEDALDAELRYHFDRLVEEDMAAGIPERDARRRARQEFGGIEAIKDACREARGTRWAHDFAADVRFALRMLARERAFTVTAVLALSLGIGVNTTLFTIANAICLRGLPIAEPSRVVDISSRDERGRPQPLSFADAETIRRGAPSALSATAAYSSRRATLRDPAIAAERVTIGYVTANTFAVLRQQPSLGRDFRSDDDVAGAPRVVILGGAIWRTRYAADPAIVGRRVTIDGAASSVIGVMPDGFRFPDNADAWQPFSAAMLAPETRAVTVFARLADGASVAQAQEMATSLLRDSVPPTAPRTAIAVTPINDRYNGRITDPVWLAFLTTGALVVVIACANVANLLLATGVRRTRELTLRLSLGATRGRIVRQLLAETSMLAGLGALGGLGVALSGLRLFTSVLPRNGLPYWITFAMDERVFATLAAAAIGTVVLAGLAPALQLARTNVSTTIRETSGTMSGSAGARRWTRVFLTVQLASTVILLSAVGITVQSFYVLQHRGPQIDARHLLTFSISLPPEEYGTAAQRQLFFRALEQRLLGPTQVAAMTLADSLPSDPGAPRRLAGHDPGATPPLVRTASVDGGYFATLGLPLIAGRPFTVEDLRNNRRVAIVDQRFAEMFLPTGKAVGETIRLADARDTTGASAQARTIVGVVPTFGRQSTLATDAMVYLPLASNDVAAVSVLVRVPGDPGSIVPFIREEVRRLDPNVPLERVATLEEANWQARWNARVSFGLIASIALVALALATVGLGTLTAHAVTQRTRELGIRLALGALPAHVVLLVLRRTIVQIAVGLVAGGVGTLAWGRVFGSPGLASAANFATVATLISVVTVAVAACIARRAARIDPLAAIRYE